MNYEWRSNLVASLRYQTLGPQVTTMAACANGCGESARGGGECRHCLTKKLAELVGEEKANALHQAMRDYALATWAVEDA